MVTQVSLSEIDCHELMSECSGISQLIDWLDGLDNRPGLSEIDSRLTNLEINIEALKKFIDYSDNGYQRNIIKKTENYEIVAICWYPGQKTPIHDHFGSDCSFLIVDGITTETVFETNHEGLAFPISSREYYPGEVCSADEPDIHQISNNRSTNLINLHVYSPPLSKYRIYDSK